MSTAAMKLALLATTRIEDYPVDLAWSPDCTEFVVAGGEGGLYRVVREGGEAVLIGRHDPGLLAVAWQPGGRLIATTGQDGSVRLWDAGAAGSAPQIVHRSPRWPTGLAWRADGQRLAFAAGRELHGVDAGGVPQVKLEAHSVPLSHVVWRGRDELVAAGHGALFVDRADRGGSVEQFVLEGTPLTLALSPDGKVVANGLADGTVNFRYLNTRKRSRMSGYEGKVDQTAWSANSRLLATSSTGSRSIVIWDFGGRGPEGSDPLQLEAHEERIESLAWQCAGAHLVSAGRDWRVVLWRPGAAQRKPLDVQLLDGPAALARWSPDGQQLAIALGGGNLRIYALRA
ncbi:MAG: hypothetical protein QM696_00490 [Steroidobacteraceae bacterium]